MNTTRYCFFSFIIFSLLATSLFSCKNKYQKPPEFQIAEKLMLQRPDSSLKLLENVKNVNKLPDELRATYNLLLIEARDKNYVVHTSDSLINTVVKYFEHQDDPVMKAKAYYYQGRVYEDMSKVEEAALSYKKADTQAQKTHEYRLQALIYNHLGQLSLYQELPKDVISWGNKAYKAILLSRDTLSSVYILRDIGRGYILLKDYNKSLSYLKRAFDVSIDHNSPSEGATILYEIALLYDQKKMNDSLLYYMRDAIKMDPMLVKRSEICLGIADAYRKSNQLDSAKYYLNKCINSENLYTKAGYTMILSEVENDKKNINKAFELYKKSVEFQDSIRSISSAKALAEVVAKYDNQKLENEKNHFLLEKTLAWRNFYFVFSLSLVLAVTFIVFFFSFKRKKDKQLRDSIHKLLTYEKQILENNRQLKTNEAWIKRATERLNETNGELKKKEGQLFLLQIRTEETQVLKKETELLENTLSDLKCQISVLTKRKDQIMALNEQLRMQSSLIDRLKVWAPGDPLLNTSEWAHLSELMNENFDGFCDKISVQFPDLTVHDIRICNLIRLGLSNEIIAHLTNCKYESLLTKRTRIKKLRMHIDGDKLLEEIIQNIK